MFPNCIARATAGGRGSARLASFAGPALRGAERVAPYASRCLVGQCLRAGALGLGLAAGASQHLAAQALGPGTYEAAPEDFYGRPTAEEYRRHQVQAVWVLEQHPSAEEPGRPLLPTQLVNYQEYDALGRPVRQYWGSPGQLTHRLDMTYGPGDELTQATNYSRLSDPADTTCLGQQWLPSTCTSYPQPTSPGASVRWDEQTGDWVTLEQSRTWQRHDTTYVATTRPAGGMLVALERSYYVGPGQHLLRHDQLRYNERGLREAQYTYARLAKKQLLEVGQLDFQPALIDYVTTHPDAVLPAAHEPPTQLLDELARHAPGHPLPLFTQTFDAHGWLLSRVSAAGREVYQRTATGQLQQSRLYRYEALVQLTHYTYLPNGLLARASTFDPQGQLASTLFYHYR